jgi:hypothetical protein
LAVRPVRVAEKTPVPLPADTLVPVVVVGLTAVEKTTLRSVTGLHAAGFKTIILLTPGDEESRNSLFIASKNTMTFTDLRTPLTYHGREVKIDSLFLDPGTLHLADARILTDDKPVLEWLNIKASASWRKDYTRTYTELFSKSGIPLFE